MNDDACPLPIALATDTKDDEIRHDLVYVPRARHLSSAGGAGPGWPPGLLLPSSP